jgi:hypothetical protein
MRNHTFMTVLEVCTFTTGDEQALRAADARMQTDFAYQQPGLRRRTTARGEAGRWCVVSLWASVDDAIRAEQAAAGDEVASAFWDLTDRDTVRVERYSLLE